MYITFILIYVGLRLGAASKEAYHEDTYPNILHRYLKFDDEMSVISVVWRECEQLIENYNDEQVSDFGRQFKRCKVKFVKQYN